MCSGKIEGLARRWPARRRAYPAGAPLLMSKAAGKPPGPAGPGPGAHGGGGLYGQGKDQPCIAARFPGCVGRGAAAPWEARIGITLQALRVTALYRLGPPGRRRNVTCRTAWGVHPIGGSRSSPLIGRFKGWVQGGGNRNPPPCPFFPPTFFGKKVGPPEAGASMGRADNIRPYRLRVKDAAPYNVPCHTKCPTMCGAYKRHNLPYIKLQTPQFAIH